VLSVYIMSVFTILFVLHIVVFNFRARLKDKDEYTLSKSRTAPKKIEHHACQDGCISYQLADQSTERPRLWSGIIRTESKQNKSRLYSVVICLCKVYDAEANPGG
jgi:hypothetical protein